MSSGSFVKNYYLKNYNTAHLLLVGIRESEFSHHLAGDWKSRLPKRSPPTPINPIAIDRFSSFDRSRRSTQLRLRCHTSQQPVRHRRPSGLSRTEVAQFVAFKPQPFLQQLLMFRWNRSRQFHCSWPTFNKIGGSGVSSLPIRIHRRRIPSLSSLIEAVAQIVPNQLIDSRILNLLIENRPNRIGIQRW